MQSAILNVTQCAFLPLNHFITVHSVYRFHQIVLKQDDKKSRLKLDKNVTKSGNYTKTDLVVIGKLYIFVFSVILHHIVASCDMDITSLNLVIIMFRCSQPS